MASLDEARTTSDSDTDHVNDHNTLHTMHNAFDGTWLHHLFDRTANGETEHADDQEFNGSIGGTAVTPTGTATWTQGLGRLSVVASGVSSNDAAARLYSLTPTSAAVTVEGCLRISARIENYMFGGICFTDGTSDSSNIATAAAYMDVNDDGHLEAYYGTVNNLNASASGYVGDMYPHVFHQVYLRVIWSAANTFKAWYSPDGVTWRSMANTSYSKTMTPTHFGVWASTWGHGSAESIVTCEYLRVTESDLSL